MDENNSGNNERHLFHATSFERLELINFHGFKRNQKKKHAKRYGKGVYFARDASKSMLYADPAGEQRYMYIARVLVGHYCQGEKEMKAPPPRNSTGRLYDSAVDKPVDPEIFVIFHDTQCYPEYLITYK
ncbi:unnamed protein product [Porites lobata]|uniref:Poly [ADP-ribose] polymerase n=1 Tax=Porites lobata TaxID=104759 RepID=A0ABN8S0B3_9CNID|nr:unnamed protein product [Porites lobata]